MSDSDITGVCSNSTRLVTYWFDERIAISLYFLSLFGGIFDTCIFTLLLTSSYRVDTYINNIPHLS